MAIYLGPNSGTNISTSTVGWVKILQVTGGSTISSIAQDDLPSSTYRAINIIGAWLPVDDGVHLNFYFRDGGSDLVANKYSTGQRIAYPDDNIYAECHQNQGRMEIAQNCGNQSGEGHRFNITYFPYVSGEAGNTDMFNWAFWDAISIDQNGNFRSIGGTGWYDVGDQDCTGFKMQTTSGQIADYTYSIYGLLK